MQTSHRFEKEITRKANIQYLLFLPYDYDGIRKFPLILFLHGAGERGEDIRKVKTHGPPKIVETDKDFPFIVVSPQCPEHTHWGMMMDELMALIGEIKDNYSVDTKQIYLTGLSMGGYGTWGLAARHPGEFAAIAPICGGWMPPQEVLTLKDTPVWAFHGGKDKDVLPEESERLVELLQSQGAEHVLLTIYPDAGHDSWTATYESKELYQWFLSHRRPSDESAD
ncbi:MAG: prolyl oligopeptidase family serine peptidase [Clostridia bacterium]